MKRIIIAFLAVFALTACNNKANAQAITLYANPDTTATGAISSIGTQTTDTLYNTSTIYTFYTKVALNNTASSKYLVTFNVTKTSGTGTAAVFLQGSTDGKVWRNLNSGVRGTDGINSDSLTVAAASVAPGVNYYYYSFDNHAVMRPTISSTPYYVNSGRCFYLRLKIIGVGTQQTIYSAAKLYTYN